MKVQIKTPKPHETPLLADSSCPGFMERAKLRKSISTVKLFAICGLALWLPCSIQADVVVLQDGKVLAGKILQQDGDGVLIHTPSGTFRYPQSWLRDVKKEPAAVPHVSNNGQPIPDWAQILTILANNTWAQGLKQVPATMIETGIWKSVPYVSFRCQYNGYEINIFGDLNKPAALQIGAMSFLKDSAEARSNCVNFVCSVLANADDRKSVRALNWTQDDTEKNGELVAKTLMPGEFGSYGGWWVSIYSESALATARASDGELLALTQPPAGASQPVAASVQPVATASGAADQAAAAAAQQAASSAQQAAAAAQQAAGAAQQAAAAAPGTAPATYPTTTYTTVPAWTAAEMADARRVSADATAAKVYPRTYTRTEGGYGRAEPWRR